jgi:hypothetical protein
VNILKLLIKDTEASFTAKYDRFFTLLFIALLIYAMVGFFPIVPMEADGIAIVNGAMLISATEIGRNIFSYCYEGQPGTYFIVIGLHKLTGLDIFTAFSIASSVFSIFFILSSVLLCREFINLPFGVVGIVILLFQESFTGGYYPNSTVLAAPFAILSLYLVRISTKAYIFFVASVLFGISAWTRFDTVLLAPLWIFLMYKGNWKQAIKQVMIFGVIAIVIILIAFYLSNIDIADIYTKVTRHKAGIYPAGMNVKIHKAFFSVLLLFLIVMGAFYAVIDRRWYLLIVVFLAITPVYIVLWGSFTTPKYFYYTIPFFSILATYAIFRIEKSSRKMQLCFLPIFVFLLMVQYVLGLRQHTLGRESRSSFPLFAMDNPLNPKTRLEIALGPGPWIPTHDLSRLSSGIMWAPRTWYKKKHSRKEELQKLQSYLEIQKEDGIKFLITEWNAYQLSIFHILRLGYSCELSNRQPKTYMCKKEDCPPVFVFYLQGFKKGLVEDKVIIENNNLRVKFIVAGLNPQSLIFPNTEVVDSKKIFGNFYEVTLAEHP